MDGTIPWDKILEYAVFGVPIAVIATLLLLLMSRRSRHRDAPAVTVQRALSEMPETSADESVAPSPVDADTLERSIEVALQAKDKTVLAALYLELARARGRAGDEAARMTALRSAAGYGALHGPHGAHAAARIDLAEAAYQAGDLTSACEQWQLARAASQADGLIDLQNKIDKRMRENGCPTDWVLTDF